MNPTRPKARCLFFALALSAAAIILLGVDSVAGAAAVDYAADVRPILEAHCFECHGPEEQESGLRVDFGATLISGGNSGPAVAAGDSKNSLLIKAVHGTDDSVSKMPPEGPGLSDEQVDILARWIDEGAQIPDEPNAPVGRVTSDHWSFQPLDDVTPPKAPEGAIVRNPIDAFVLRRLAETGLAPSVEADRTTLIRRLSLDLIGLPPTVEQVDAFLADRRDDAYERLVDALLNSPHYGERWGRHWLDLARYADSNGYTIDGGRSIWKYRDWVIEALNRDLPFDQFTVEQIAGDMLPGARIDQKIATGFHRNTLVNEEGGTDDEQFRVEAVVDRVATTGAVFLGLTLGCARCHDHKYDPITQREFYELFAVFNNADEPTLPVPTDQQAKELPALNAEIRQSEERLATVDANSGTRQVEWEAKLAATLPLHWTVLDVAASSSGGATFRKLADGSLLAGGEIPRGDVYTVSAARPDHAVTALMLESLPDASLPNHGPGLDEQGAFVLHELSVALAAEDGSSQPVALASARSAYSPKEGPIGNAIDGSTETGWTFTDAKQAGLPQAAIFHLKQPIPDESVGRLVVTLTHQSDDKPRQIGRFRILVTGAPPTTLSQSPEVRDAVRRPAAERTDEQRKAIRQAFLKIDPERVPLAAQIAELRKRKKQVEAALTTTLVMRERTEPRETHIHLRGSFLRHGAKVEPGVPRVLPPIKPRGVSADRLDFARWLVDARNPLTARVTVNRVWQRYFGRGLVATENDFGTQGEPPSHPELLDWLARQFIAEGWSLKALHRLIVTSATYRQASLAPAKLAGADPYNELLGRQRRLRLEAESIRDVALAAAGMLSRDIGGPGVYPPQPEGIYRFTQTKKFWGTNQGPDRYRRGMYTYLWRSSPYPFLKTFDAPDATVTCTRRPRSNTPLQALTLANDPAFFEIARGFSTNLLAAPAADDLERIRLAFRRCLSRQPTAEELSQLSEYLNAERQRFADSPDDALAVAPKNSAPYGATAVPADPSAAEVAQAAAWTMVARVLLNLDEFITRE